MEWTKREQHFKVFEKYMDALKGRSVKYFIPESSNYHDRKIRKFMEYFKIPIPFEDVIIFLDTTAFRSAKEGFLFTTEGVVIKEVMEKLYFLQFSKIDRAEIEEIVDPETTKVTRKLNVWFKDGTMKRVFDYDIRKDFFADYINDAVELTEKMARKEEQKAARMAGTAGAKPVGDTVGVGTTDTIQ